MTEPGAPDMLLRAMSHLVAYAQRGSGYQAREEIERLLAPLRGDPKRLEPYGFKVYSQQDEDGILEEIFRRLGVERGSFLEIGVEDGLECNTLYLIHKGWRGHWVEGDEKRRGAIEAKFAPVLGRRLQVGFGFVTAANINQVLASAPADLDFLSIDVDGMDIYLLEALASSPKVICVEYNAKFPPNLSKRPSYDPKFRWAGADYMGSSLLALTEAAEAKGYRLVATNITGANAFFVRADLAGDLFPEPATAAALYNPPRYWLWADHFKHLGHRPDFGPYVDLLED